MQFKGEQFEFEGEMQTARQIRAKYPCYSDRFILSALRWGAKDRAGLDKWEFESKRRVKTQSRINAALNDKYLIFSERATKCADTRRQKEKWAMEQRAKGV
jgi:hypothetical protein